MSRSPLFVTVPLVEQFASAAGGFAVLSDDVHRQEFPIGIVEGYKIVGQSDLEAAGRDLGKETGLFIMQPSCERGMVCAMIAFAVKCATIEEAQEMPGFVPLFLITGKQKALP